MVVSVDMTGMPPSLCQRTRVLLSERLDVGLSEVERLAVARHTSECAACAAFEAQAGWLTEELRSAPLESPLRPVIVSPARVRRVPSRVAANAVSAAAMLVIVVGGLAIGTDASVDEAQDLALTSGPAAESALSDPLRAIRVEALRAGELPILPAPDLRPAAKPARPATDS
jgi:predicted anti-sigma-YlaC factor YlaD